MGMRLMLHVTKAGEDPGNAVTNTPSTISVSNIETVNYSVLHASFVQTIINRSIIMTCYTPLFIQ